MSMKTISRVLMAALVVAALGQVFQTNTAEAGGKNFKLLNQTGCDGLCPACGHCCNLEAEQVDVEKKCFEIECKVICIPRVVFPWQKKKARGCCDSCDSCDGAGCTNCVHNGAKTRTIKVLKSKKYKCPECKYSWNAEKVGCGSGCCDSGCDAGCCDGATPYTSAPMEYRELDAAPAPVEIKTDDLPQPIPAQ